MNSIEPLTEIAHDAGFATGYRINETPMLQPPNFKHGSGNPTYITQEDWAAVDDVIDWLMEENRPGYKMVNSVRRLQEMKAFLRGQLQQWDCRGGQNSPIILTMKVECQKRCFSTLNHNLAYCYDASRAIRWLLKQAANGFRGTTGSFED